MSLAKRFSLDYLVSGSNSSNGGPSGLAATSKEEAIQAFVSPVLQELEKTPAQPRPFPQLFKAVQSSLNSSASPEGFLDVVKWMAKAKLVKVVTDSEGEFLIQKT